MNPFMTSKAIEFAIFQAKKFKGALLAAGAAVAVLGAGFVSGYQYHAATIAPSPKEVVRQVVVRDEIERKVYVQDLATVRRLEAEKAELRKQVATLQRKVNDYVPETPDTPYLSWGAVGLLDAAATGIDPATATTAAGQPLSEGTGPSDVTWRELVSSDLEVRAYYRQAQSQCNALIDWVEANIVNKNTKK